MTYERPRSETARPRVSLCSQASQLVGATTLRQDRKSAQSVSHHHETLNDFGFGEGTHSFLWSKSDPYAMRLSLYSVDQNFWKERAIAAAKKSGASSPEKRSQILTHFWHAGLGDVLLSAAELELAIPHLEKATESTKTAGYIKTNKDKLARAQKLAGQSWSRSVKNSWTVRSQGFLRPIFT